MPTKSGKFTYEEDLELLERYGHGETQTEIAKQMDRSRTSVRDRGYFFNLDWQEENQQERWKQAFEIKADLEKGAMQEATAPASLQPINLTVEPRKTKALVDNLPWVDVIYGDVHFPFQDPAAVEVLYKLLELLSVDRVYDLGDIIDNWQISSFLPPDERKLTAEQKDFSAQFEAAAKHLGQVRSICPNAELHLLEGNHEERWDRMLRHAQTDYRWRHILGLPQVAKALQLESLMGVKGAGWEYHPYKKNEILVNKHLLATHGDRSTKWVTRQMLERYGKSVLFGHTHRVQNWVKRDLKATEAAWSIGCLCDLDPHYGDSVVEDWAQGLAVVVSDGPPDKSDHFNVIQLRIHWGICVTPWGTIKA
jgi:UDP-2,3-diacylglucosamine pyrophosphatase LpxH